MNAQSESSNEIDEDGGVLKGFLMVAFGWLFSKLLRNHGRRLVCLTTLYRHLVAEKVVRSVPTEELNDTLALAKNHKALEFPQELYTTFWKTSDIRQAAITAGIINPEGPADFNDECIRVFCKELSKSAPRAMRYSDSIDALVADLTKVIHSFRSSKRQESVVA